MDFRENLLDAIVGALDNEIVDEAADEPCWYRVAVTHYGLRVDAVNEDGDEIDYAQVEIR